MSLNGSTLYRSQSVVEQKLCDLFHAREGNFFAEICKTKSMKKSACNFLQQYFRNVIFPRVISGSFRNSIKICPPLLWACQMISDSSTLSTFIHLEIGKLNAIINGAIKSDLMSNGNTGGMSFKVFVSLTLDLRWLLFLFYSNTNFLRI